MKSWERAYKINEGLLGKVQAQKIGEARNKEIEELLIKGMEIAELSGSSDFINRSCQSYLQHSLLRSREVEVRYQIAKLLYDQGNYEISVEQMSVLAREGAPFMAGRTVGIAGTAGIGAVTGTFGEKKKPEPLAWRGLAENAERRKKMLEILWQASDLALDALVILKKDGDLERLAREMAGLFKSKRAEYMGIVVKSILNQTAQYAKQWETHKKNKKAIAFKSLNLAWDALNRMPMEYIREKNRFLYLKNRLALAEHLSLFVEARSAVDHLLAFPKLSLEDRKWMARKKVWLCEMTLDFKSAYELAKTSDFAPPKKRSKKDLLHLTLLAELAEEDYLRHYKEFILRFPNEEGSVLMAKKIVGQSTRQQLGLAQKTLRKYKSILMRDPELFAQLQLEIFAKERRLGPVQKAILVSDVAKSPAGRILKRHLFFKDFEAIRDKIQGHALRTKSQRALSFSLKQRDRKIGALEKFAQKTLSEPEKDWTSQFLSLSLLFKELNRFYKDILVLPIPAELTEEERAQYVSILRQQASPYKSKADNIYVTLQAFWNEDTLEKIKQGFTENIGASEDLKNLFVKEIFLLKEALNTGEDREVQLAQELESLLGSKVSASEARSTAVAMASSEKNPKEGELEKARKFVQENPVSKRALKRLISLEIENKNTAMISYLKQRLDILEKGISL